MMKSNLVLALALIGFIASTACTRNGQGSAPPPPISQAPAASPTPIPSSKSELDGGSGKSAQDPKTAPDQNRNQNQNKNRNQNQNDGPIVVTNPTDDQPQTVVYDPTGMTPDEIFGASRRQGQPVVGDETQLENGQSADPLFYSGSGQDTLRSQLQDYVDSKTEPVNEAGDKALAAKTSQGRFDIDWSTRRATLDIVVGGRAHRISGRLSNRLTLSGKSGTLTISAVCMDQAGGCQTVYALVQDTSNSIAKNAHVIIRQTPATLYTKADGFGIARNPEFDSLLETLVRTDNHAGDLNALNGLGLMTSETINGPSDFVVRMNIVSVSGTQETLNLGGNLVKPLDQFSMSADARVLRSSTSPAARSIRDVTLVKNDGRGDLTLAVTVRKSTAESSEDTMELTFARIHKQVRPLILK